jgi:hypothetical protein
MAVIKGVAGGLALGAVVGVLSSLANAASSPVGVAASLVLNAGWAWAAVPVAAGWCAGTWRAGAVAGVLALAVTTTAYYVTDSFLRHEPIGMYRHEMRYWWLAGVGFGSLLGGVGGLVRRPGVLGLLAGLTVPVGAAVEMAWLPRWDATSMPPTLDAVRVVVWAAAALAAGLVLVRYTLSSGPASTPELSDPARQKIPTVRTAEGPAAAARPHPAETAGDRADVPARAARGRTSPPG